MVSDWRDVIGEWWISGTVIGEWLERKPLIGGTVEGLARAIEDLDGRREGLAQ